MSGRVVAWANATVIPGRTGDTLDVHIECASGHQPPWARRLLVHDLLNRAARAGVVHVMLACPLGDIEVIDALDEHCRAAVTRSAGATCIVEADLRAALQPARAS